MLVAYHRKDSMLIYWLNVPSFDRYPGVCILLYLLNTSAPVNSEHT